jgi:hypothetical protein
MYQSRSIFDSTGRNKKIGRTTNEIIPDHFPLGSWKR